MGASLTVLYIVVVMTAMAVPAIVDEEAVKVCLNNLPLRSRQPDLSLAPPPHLHRSA
jgi:hypothetical protein